MASTEKILTQNKRASAHLQSQLFAISDNLSCLSFSCNPPFSASFRSPFGTLPCLRFGEFSLSFLRVAGWLLVIPGIEIPSWPPNLFFETSSSRTTSKHLRSFDLFSVFWFSRTPVDHLRANGSLKSPTIVPLWCPLEKAFLVISTRNQTLPYCTRSRVSEGRK